MSFCIRCGDEMLGDGFNSALVCPNSDFEDHTLEPDSVPYFCALVLPVEALDNE